MTRLSARRCPESGLGLPSYALAVTLLLLSGCGGDEQALPAANSPAQEQDGTAGTPAPIAAYEGQLEVVSFTLDSVFDMQGNPVATVEVDEPDLILHFTAENREDARIWIQDPNTGAVLQQLYAGRVKAGLNAFRFQHDPLPKGTWEVVVTFQAGMDTIQTVLFTKK